MPFQLAHVLNYGTSTPAVARTVLQGKDIIQLLVRTPEQDEQAGLALGDLMKGLLRCVETHDDVANAVADACQKLAAGTLILRPQPNVLRPPAIANLDGKAESFLQAAKLAIARATKLTEPFYGRSFGHKLNKLEGWATAQLGKGHDLVQFARHWQPWVKSVLAMRDAVDHPGDRARGRLRVRNFYVEEQASGLVLHEPQWALDDEPLESMPEGMARVIEGDWRRRIWIELGASRDHNCD